MLWVLQSCPWVLGLSFMSFTFLPASFAHEQPRSGREQPGGSSGAALEVALCQEQRRQQFLQWNSLWNKSIPKTIAIHIQCCQSNQKRSRWNKYCQWNSHNVHGHTSNKLHTRLSSTPFPPEFNVDWQYLFYPASLQHCLQLWVMGGGEGEGFMCVAFV